MKKRIVCLMLAVMMMGTQVATVSASREEELREEQAWTSAQLDATYSQIDQLYAAKEQLQNEIAALDANLVNVMVSFRLWKGISAISRPISSRHSQIFRKLRMQKINSMKL